MMTELVYVIKEITVKGRLIVTIIVARHEMRDPCSRLDNPFANIQRLR